MFKNLLVLTLVLAIAYSAVKKHVIQVKPETVGTLLPALQECMSKTKVSSEAILAVLQGRYMTDQNFKNFIFCNYKTTGYLDGKDYLIVEKACKAFGDEPIFAEGVRRCARETSGPNPKEILFNFFKCFQDTVPVRFVL